MTGVNLQAVTKKFGDVQVIHGVDLKVEDGEFCVFVGPSGCGKSTLLRMIAGLEKTTGGQIAIGDRDVTDADPADRGVAMVFQTYALYPHMTVAENMGFGLKMTGHPKAEIAAKVAEASRILKLDDYLVAQTQGACRAASVSVWRLVGPSCAGPRCSCLTNPCRTLMPNCAWKCGSKSPACTAKSARP